MIDAGLEMPPHWNEFVEAYIVRFPGTKPTKNLHASLYAMFVAGLNSRQGLGPDKLTRCMNANGFAVSRPYTKPDPRGSEYGSYEAGQEEDGTIVVAHRRADGILDYTMRFDLTSFMNWISNC